ncbi:MAG: iron chaperone [Gemmatimonadaceae bacterium]
MTTRAKAKKRAKPKARTAAKSKPKTVDEYLATLSADNRAALNKLRKNIVAAAPGAVECISYQIPAFRFQGRMLVWFGAWENHCALYPGTSIEPFRKELGRFDTGSKGTVRFQADDPLPATLVRKLVKARIAQNAARQQKKDG